MGLIQKKTYTSVTEQTNHSVTFSSAVTAGNTLIAVVTSTAVITTPAGWTKIQGSLSGLDMGAFRKTAVGGDSTVNFTISAARGINIVVYEFNDLVNTVAASAGLSSISPDDIQFPEQVALENVRFFAVIGLGPVDGNEGSTGWSGGTLDSHKDNLFASSIADPQGQLAAYSDMNTNDAFVPTVRPGPIVATSVQGIAFMIQRTTTPPIVVNAGVDQSIASNQAAQLGASASGGLAGLYAYAWTVSTGPVGAFSNPTLINPTFTPTGGSGTYVLQCVASDASGSGSNIMTLTVDSQKVYYYRENNAWVTPVASVRISGTWV